MQLILFKIIIKKIKGLFGVNQKPQTSTNVSTPSKEVKPTNNVENKTQKKEYKKDYSARKHVKKETREEYKARHEKMAANKTVKHTSPKVDIVDNWDPKSYVVPTEEGKTRFSDLEIANPILHAIADLDFKYCTDVQAETLPSSLKGNDITAQAQTGTGKTAAFLITVFNHLINNPIDTSKRHGFPRIIILAPTRELVMQIEKDAKLLGKYLPFTLLSVVGGINYNKQQQLLSSTYVDIVICTPGRLIDFLNKKLIDLTKIEILVIDEADRMLDMGFLPSVRQIVLSTPPKSKRQTMFFTATMSFDVMNLAESWTKNAIDVKVKPSEITTESIEQITYLTTVEEKRTLLYNIIMQKNLERVLVFANRRDEARLLKDTFTAYGISCALLSGEVEQTQRTKRLESFREGKIRVLVATDVASRGIHVDAISHVINYNIPQDVEEYIHRIGRTGRAGASGISISFADEDSSHELLKLEEMLGKKIECIYPEENLLTPIPEKFEKIKLSKSPHPVKKPFNKSKNFRYKRPNNRTKPKHEGTNSENKE